MGKHNELGKLGEEKAIAYLQKKGYTIKYKNYRYLKGEIDIIAQKENILAIVEVKSRTNAFLEDLSETVNPKKIKLLVATANQYVMENNLDLEVRFDIVTVLQKGTQFQLEHLEDAFYHF
ncbi:Hypothetical protein I595_1907 [Croceitalea dokdonensis DOKDO 023]|uniref:UPF0102 protein I595_1907 n=1 Tax=Croceitalea dokdonensis DOKDO 023 TaxID=1300341 RepID=A0A0P7AW56_9FLAO|nr:YraN family protein [Croceitalea dokdonensis]KPM32257.1 Hypothetical protein I595_1907 [Croceitalea dokdonensis DOKDO 023]